MKRVTFDIVVLADSSTKRVKKSVSGYEVCEGLAAHRPHGRKRGWIVSHINSGCAATPRAEGRAKLAQVKSWIDQAQEHAPIDWTFEGRYMPSEVLALSNKWLDKYRDVSSNY